jgi:glutamate 5-kinase
VQVAQVLLTHYNFDTPREERTILRILDSYLSRGMVPVINENDLVNKEEFDFRGHFTDNDILAALVATHVKPDLAVILTNVDGLHAGGEHGPLIPEVEQIDDDIRAHASQEASPLGLGGMLSKVEAADRMTGHGIDVIVGNGSAALGPLIDGSAPRTLFRAQRRSAARSPSAAMARV